MHPSDKLESIITEILGSDTDYDQNNKNEYALLKSIRHDETLLSKILIKSNKIKNYNFVHDGYTALILAIEKKRIDMVKTLVDAGADVNFGVGNNIPLIVAATNGDIQLVKLLVEKGKANLNVVDSIGGDTALICAAMFGHAPIVGYLVRSGANYQTTNLNGYTALTATKKHNNLISKFLIDRDIDVDVPDFNGRTALMHAIADNNKKLVKMLILANADIDHADREGKTALILATVSGHTEFVHYLIHAKAKIDAQDNDNKTALIYAVEKGYHGIVQSLVDEGADLDIMYPSNNPIMMPDYNALICAVWYMRTEIVEILVNRKIKGVYLDDRNSDSESALFCAALAGFEDIVNILIKSGAKLDLQNKCLETPLIIATNRGFTSIVKALLDAGADPNIVNDDNESALKIALELGYADIIRLILDKQFANPIGF